MFGIIIQREKARQRELQHQRKDIKKAYEAGLERGMEIIYNIGRTGDREAETDFVDRLEKAADEMQARADLLNNGDGLRQAQDILDDKDF